MIVAYVNKFTEGKLAEYLSFSQRNVPDGLYVAIGHKRVV